MSCIQQKIKADTFGRLGVLKTVNLKFSVFRDVTS